MWRRILLRIVIRILQLQFLALFIYIICYLIAGPQNSAAWFVAISLALLVLAICRVVLD